MPHDFCLLAVYREHCFDFAQQALPILDLNQAYAESTTCAPTRACDQGLHHSRVRMRSTRTVPAAVTAASRRSSSAATCANGATAAGGGDGVDIRAENVSCVSTQPRLRLSVASSVLFQWCGFIDTSQTCSSLARRQLRRSSPPEWSGSPIGCLPGSFRLQLDLFPSQVPSAC
jgi:hypothetical protein